MSRALMITYGSQVLRVVETVMEPSIRSSWHAMPCSRSNAVTDGHASRRYDSRYEGKSTANDDSSVSEPPTMSPLVNFSVFQWSTLSSSHGLSGFLCLGIDAFAAGAEGRVDVRLASRSAHGGAPRPQLETPLNVARRRRVLNTDTSANCTQELRERPEQRAPRRALYASVRGFIRRCSQCQLADSHARAPWPGMHVPCARTSCRTSRDCRFAT